MFDDVEYRFDDFEVGEQVEYQSDESGRPWKTGTVVHIDYDDPSLPWGVTRDICTCAENGDPHECSWDWKSPHQVQKSEYVILEEEDIPQIAVSW